MDISELDGKHRGQIGIVVCNGPSVSDIDKRLLTDTVCIGCNGVYQFDPPVPISYYCIEDRKRLKQTRANVNKLQVPKLIPRDILNMVNRDRFVCPINFIRTKYAPDDGPEFSCNAKANMYWGCTVAYMMLQLAVYMELNPIIIVGKDGARADEKKHGYEEEPHIQHNKPNYDRSDAAFRKAAKAIAAIGISVYDATPNPVMHFFPNVRLEELL